MHILLLPSWYPKTSKDVSGIFFRDQALALLRYGHKVGVIAPLLRSLRTLFDKPSDRSMPFFELDEGILTYRKHVWAALPRVPYGNYQIFKRVARKLMEDYIRHHGAPEILHAHASLFGGAVAAELAKEFGIPMVLTEHSSGFARGIYAPWQLKLTEEAIGGASLCIVVSPSLGELLGEQFPKSKDRWSWIPNVVADRFNVPTKMDFEKCAPRFLNLALMTENKGQADLISAFHLLVERGGTGELWLAGDGPIRAELELQAQELDISNKVRFLGMVKPENVPQLLQQADVMVVSSHYETFGVVAAEALMAGLPVIATQCGGPECIVQKSDGMLVPTRDPEALCEAMQKLTENHSFYDRQEIAERAKYRFSGPSVAARLTQEYKSVLSKTSASGNAG